MLIRRSLASSAELDRICDLPRRIYSDHAISAVVRETTDLYRQPDGKQTLRAEQAIALAEIKHCGGILGPIYVGGGKTLISLLAPSVGSVDRPLILLPAHLVSKTLAEIEEYRKHWRIRTDLNIYSYQHISSRLQEKFLDELAPDMIVCDEVHRLRNPKAAVTRRVRRYLEKNPHVRFVALSGTITSKSIIDYAHISRWALGSMSPLPRRYGEVLEWSAVLDTNVMPFNRIHPGEMMRMFDEKERAAAIFQPVEAARSAFHRRLVETPGVVASLGSSGVAASLHIRAIKPPRDPVIEDVLADLRGRWIAPDGTELCDAIAVWRYACEEALGFYYRWEPTPPDGWIEARSAWARVCRRILHGRKFDSEGQIVAAVRSGALECPEFWAWDVQRIAFQPSTVPVWLSRSRVDFIAEWLQRAGRSAIGWVGHVALGKALEHLGFPYFGSEGRDASGRSIEEYFEPTAPVLSIAANSEGRNLQRFSLNLVTTPPANGARWEQLLGRTHRPGQDADEVIAHVLFACDENRKALEQAINDAQYIEKTTGARQKLVFASKDLI